MTQHVHTPDSTDSWTYEQLAYIEAYDAVLNSDYAYVAYCEKSRSDGRWQVQIRSNATAGASLDPEAIRLQARAAGAQGKSHFTWGFTLEPSEGDPRQVEFRIHLDGGQASEVELFVRMRRFDHSADEPKSVRFPWPGAAPLAAPAT
jgi:hypothetical protein